MNWNEVATLCLGIAGGLLLADAVRAVVKLVIK